MKEGSEGEIGRGEERRGGERRGEERRGEERRGEERRGEERRGEGRGERAEEGRERVGATLDGRGKTRKRGWITVKVSHTVQKNSLSCSVRGCCYYHFLRFLRFHHFHSHFSHFRRFHQSKKGDGLVGFESISHAYPSLVHLSVC